MAVERDSKKIIKRLKKESWFLVGCKGDDHQFKHPDIKGRVTVPHPVKDLPKGTVGSIYRQARWK